MRSSKPGPLNAVRLGARLIIPVVLPMLLLAALLLLGGGSSPTLASPSSAPNAATLDNGSVITIGVAAALTYEESEDEPFFGWLQVNAVQLAISQTNAAGGVDIGGTTYSLALVTADSACSPTKAISAAHTLLDAGAVAVVGHTCSNATAAAQGVYSAAGAPMVSASSTTPNLTEQGITTTFRVIPRDDAPSVEMARHFREELGMERVAAVDWRAFGWSTDAFSQTFTGLGGSITGADTVSDTADYTATLTAIRAGEPEAIFYAHFDQEEEGARAGLFSAVAHNLGLTTIGWHVGDVQSIPDAYAEAAGPAAEGDYAARFGRDTGDMPGYEALDDAYQAADFTYYSAGPGTLGAYAYDGAQVIIAALKRAGSVDPMAIRDQIALTDNYEGVVGTYEGFDAQGDVIPQWSWVERYENGKWGVEQGGEVFLPLILNNLP